MNWTQADVDAHNAKVGRKLGPGDRDALALEKEHSEAVGRESDLDDEITKYCRGKGWLDLHGSAAHRTKRTLGEFDHVIFADGGRVFCVELKSKTGKLRPEQAALKIMLDVLGHGDRYGLCRCMNDFLNLVTK